MRLSDLKKFPISFWLLCVACLTYYGTISSFLTLAQQYFKSEFGRTSSQANRLLGLVYFVSAAVSPLLGLLLDRLGKNMTCIMVAVLTTGASHGLLFCHQPLGVSPYLEIDLVVMAVAFSLLTSATMPIAALLIPEQQLSTAYGLIQAILNLGTAVITMAASTIVKTKTSEDNTGNDYQYMEAFFIFLLGVCLLCIVIIWVRDIFTGGNLNMFAREREVRSVVKR